MRTRPLVLAALLLASILAPLAESQGQGMPGSGPGGRRGGERERVAADEEARDWGNLSESARQRGLQRAEAARLFSRMAYEDGAVSSRFVTFNYSDGSLLDFAVRSGENVTRYFDLNVTGFDPAQPRVTGAVFRAMGNETYLAAHGNPLGLFVYRVRNSPLQMSFELAEGVNVTADNERTFMVTGPTGLHGHVVLSANATYEVSEDDRSVSVSLGPHARLLFLHHAPRTPFTGTLHALRDAASSERVGGILSVVGDEEGPLQDRIFLSGVAMRATHAKDGRVDVLVSSENAKGRSVVINVDPASLGFEAGADVTVLLDGQPVPSAGNAAEALNSSAALAHVNVSETGIQAIVAIPEFSDHTVTLTTEAPAQPTTTTTTAGTTPAGSTPPTGQPAVTQDEPDNGAPGAGVALVLVAVAALAVARRKR